MKITCTNIQLTAAIDARRHNQ